MTNEERLIDLEMRITHHERSIEELRQTSFEQYLMIDRLEKQIKKMTDRMDNGGGGGADIGPADEKAAALLAARPIDSGGGYGLRE